MCSVFEEEIVSSAPDMPSLLHFRESVEDGFTVWGVGFIILEALDIHAGVNPCERSSQLLCEEKMAIRAEQKSRVVGTYP